jgi:zinc D-Ala-D-Ala carboxypeptidase
MKFSKNFSLSEIEHSNTAKRLSISNEMPEKHLESMQRLITDLIQPLRDAIGPIRVTSGYRSKELNRAIGGSNRSLNNKVIYDWILESGLEFDQMINEFDFAWIHISLKKDNNRKQILEAYKDKEGDTAYKLAII